MNTIERLAKLQGLLNHAFGRALWDRDDVVEAERLNRRLASVARAVACQVELDAKLPVRNIRSNEQ